MKKYWFEIKSVALLLFFIGGLLFSLGTGYGRRFYKSGNSGFSVILSISGLLLVLPYVVIIIYENFFRKEESKAKPEPAGLELADMETMERNLKESIVEITEYTEEIPGLSRAYKELSVFGEIDMPKPVLQHESVVYFKIKIGDKSYKRAEVFPFSAENTKICIAMNPVTKIFYHRDTPENFTIDLSFINQYL